MGKLTTHVLDTAHGKPGAGIAVALYRMNGYERQFVSGHTTNADGRADAPLLQGPTLTPGTYELLFHVGDYYRAKATTLPAPSLPCHTSLLTAKTRLSRVADSRRHASPSITCGARSLASAVANET